jgi:hypothetical protein
MNWEPKPPQDFLDWMFDPDGWFRRHRPHHHHHRVVLVIDNVAILLKPNEENFVMVDVTVGHTISMALKFWDQNGNPMLVDPTPDAAPAWTNTAPATETLTPSSSGLACTATTVAVGTDVITVALAVASAPFTATLAVNVTAVPQVLTAVTIEPTVS